MKRAIVATVVLVCCASAIHAQQTELFFPLAASTPGKLGTFWQTDAWIFNPDAVSPVTVHVSYFYRDVDNTGVQEISVEIPPRQGVAFTDLVAVFLGEGQAGAVRMRADGPFLAVSRTYNIGDGMSGTFGHLVPGRPASMALVQGVVLGLANDPAGDGVRSNVGLLNPGSVPVTVTLSLWNRDTGAFLGTFDRVILPQSVGQLNDVFLVLGIQDQVLGNVSLEFLADGPLLINATVIDNTSGDAVYVEPFPDTGTPMVANNPPQGEIVSPEGNLTIQAGSSVTFVGTVEDPDGDDIDVLWDYGDGVSATQLEPEPHTFTDPGMYEVVFTATDEHGLADPTPDSRFITVVPQQLTLFDRVQNEIFTPSCANPGCHSTGTQRSGLDLSQGNSHADTVNVPSEEQPSLDRIEPFSALGSYLWLKVIDDESISGVRMPLGGDPLPQSKLDLLRDWILAGAPED